MANPLCSVVDNESTFLAADYSVGSGIFTLVTGEGARIAAKIASSGFPPISSTNPFRVTAARLSAFDPDTGRIINESLIATYKATGISGDTLTGASVEPGYTDQPFYLGDVLACNTTARQFSEMYDAMVIADGKPGGQTIYGGTGPGENLTLRSTSDPTKGIIQLGAGGLVGVNTSTPMGQLDITSALDTTVGLVINVSATQTASLLAFRTTGGALFAGYDFAGNWSFSRSINQTTTNINAVQTAPSVQSQTTTGDYTTVDYTVPVPPSVFAVAFQFTATYTGLVKLIGFRLKNNGTITNLANTMRFRIYSDNSNTVGTPITGDSPTFLSFGALTGSYATCQASPGVTTSITSGTKYWLVLHIPVAPTGASVLMDTGTGSNPALNVLMSTATNSGLTTWSAPTTVAPCWFTLYGSSGAGLNVRSDCGNAINATSGAFTAVNFGSTTGKGLFGQVDNNICADLRSLYATVLQVLATHGAGITSQSVNGQPFLTKQTSSINATNALQTAYILRESTLGAFDLTGAVLRVESSVADTGPLLELRKQGTNRVVFNGAGQMNSAVAQTTAGAATFSQPLAGSSWKRVVIYMNNLTGAQSYTFPVPFTNTPSVVATNDVAASIVTSRSTTAVTVTGAATTGFIFLEGY